MLHETNSRVKNLLEREIDNSDSLSEIAVARTISREIDEGSVLWLGSSMPIREIDMYATTEGPSVPVAANRGASGIDGSISSFLGFVQGAQHPGVALIGDLAFLHDINSLALVRSLNRQVIIVVVNNDGGGIFSFLPIADCQDIFEPYFGTPHGLSFEKAAEMFAIQYFHPETLTSFRDVLRKAKSSGKSIVIEVKTNRQENMRMHRDIQQKIKDLIQT